MLNHLLIQEGGTHPPTSRLDLPPARTHATPRCHHATRPTSERGRSLFREANLYVHPLCACVRYIYHVAPPRSLPLALSKRLVFAYSTYIRGRVYAGISQRAANLWSREARFNPLRFVSGYSFRLWSGFRRHPYPIPASPSAPGLSS